eukprot:COSAG02_NODE_40536_length_404_cov_0.934426_1_plen_46_part_10
MEQLSRTEDAEESNWSINLVAPLSKVWSSFWRQPSSSNADTSEARP